MSSCLLTHHVPPSETAPPSCQCNIYVVFSSISLVKGLSEAIGLIYTVDLLNRWDGKVSKKLTIVTRLCPLNTSHALTMSAFYSKVSR